MPNVKFNYRYRDSANYKTHGHVIFGNPTNLSLESIETQIRAKLIDAEFFYARDWHIPDLFPTTFNPYDDPTWHEFESVEFTDEVAGRHIELTKLPDQI